MSGDGEHILLKYTPQSSVYLLFSKDSSVPIWDTSVWTSYSSSISGDGNYLAYSHYDSYDNSLITLRDTSTGLAIMSGEFSQDSDELVESISLSYDGKYIALGERVQGQKIYVLQKNSSTPLWSYDVGGQAQVKVSEDTARRGRLYAQVAQEQRFLYRRCIAR